MRTVGIVGRLIALAIAALAIVLAPAALEGIVPENTFSAAVPSTQLTRRANDVASSVGRSPAQTTRPGAGGADAAPRPARPAFTPRQEYVPADPSNYGERFLTDVDGRPVSNPLIVVIHETVGSASSAINRFRTPHPRDADQASYHSLIRRDGSIVYLVPPEMRAFGAGNSVFDGPNGPETVRTNAAFPPSVNNFAYHTSLETPPDGRGNSRRHSGYTEAQYRSLAWLVAQTNIPNDRITTHRAVDRSGTRLDPRSFDAQRFAALLQTFRNGG